MASVVRYRYIGETPVTVPDLSWGDEDNPVMPGDISAPYSEEVHSSVLVPVGSPEEADWLKRQSAASAETPKGGKG